MPTAKRNNRSSGKARKKAKSKSKAQVKAKTRAKPVKSSKAKPKPKPKPKVKAKTKPNPLAKSELVETRNSPIHGSGVYAIKPIRKGTRVLEYLGERVSHYEADSRYELKPEDDGHTFLFIVDGRTVIDAAVGGNEARFINHSCDANCETVIEKRRVFIEATRNIKPGEELGYDYQLTWESTDDPAELALYDCRCGAASCRKTMLDPEPLDKKKKKKGARA